jgi:hypothetical protein
MRQFRDPKLWLEGWTEVDPPDLDFELKLVLHRRRFVNASSYRA